MKIKKGDTVQIIRGKEKGKKGLVERVFPMAEKVLIPDVNQFKKHQKGRYGGQKSEILTITKPLPLASVRLVCPKCSQLVRVGYVVEDTKKMRVCKKCGASFL